ncbi:hypothetical protein JVU11DRAFT_6772 [Chiua virens]|nr:hypothetical protein JVU11DRAFT_6772 [Chiua virens]
MGADTAIRMSSHKQTDQDRDRVTTGCRNVLCEHREYLFPTPGYAGGKHERCASDARLMFNNIEVVARYNERITDASAPGSSFASPGPSLTMTGNAQRPSFSSHSAPLGSGSALTHQSLNSSAPSVPLVPTTNSPTLTNSTLSLVPQAGDSMLSPESQNPPSDCPRRTVQLPKWYRDEFPQPSVPVATFAEDPSPSQPIIQRVILHVHDTI